MKNPFESRLRRGFQLAKMASQIGLKELASGNVQSRIEQAKILVESLGQLKGAAMKAGQILSLDLDDYFPPEAVQILSQLQNQAPILTDLDIHAVLRRELTDDKRTQLTDIGIKPIAAASMGQVYRAQLHGKQVVLKAQYPSVESSLDSDIALLKTVVKGLCAVTGRNFDLNPLFDEFTEVLKKETDYHYEADATEKFQSLFAEHTWPGARVVAPQVFKDFSSRRLLCLSYESGPTLKEWIQTRPPLEERLHVGRSLLELFVAEFYKWGMVQTDPNPANFLVRKNPDLEIVALDFGATKTYDKDFRRAYFEIIKAAHKRDRPLMLERSISFGLLDARETEEGKKLFLDLLDHGMKAFHDGATVFKFDDEEYMKNNARISRELIKVLKFSPPPSRLLFLHRKLGGVYALLRKLEIELDIRPFWDTILKYDKG